MAASNVIPFPAPAPRAVPHIGTAPDERIAALLLALEDRPLDPPFAFAATDIAGRAFVGVILPGFAVRLDADAARLAARCLFAEQAFVGCVEAGRRLTFAAQTCDGLAIRGRA